MTNSYLEKDGYLSSVSEHLRAETADVLTRNLILRSTISSLYNHHSIVPPLEV